jgi:hypothetical protein
LSCDLVVGEDSGSRHSKHTHAGFPVYMCKWEHKVLAHTGRNDIQFIQNLFPDKEDLTGNFSVSIIKSKGTK